MEIDRYRVWKVCSMLKKEEMPALLTMILMFLHLKPYLRP